jgi:hypothetical protein
MAIRSSGKRATAAVERGVQVPVGREPDHRRHRNRRRGGVHDRCADEDDPVLRVDDHVGDTVRPVAGQVERDDDHPVRPERQIDRPGRGEAHDPEVRIADEVRWGRVVDGPRHENSALVVNRDGGSFVLVPDAEVERHDHPSASAKRWVELPSDREADDSEVVATVSSAERPGQDDLAVRLDGHSPGDIVIVGLRRAAVEGDDL